MTEISVKRTIILNIVGRLKDFLEHKCPKVVAAAWARELRRMRVILKIGSITSKPIGRTRALLQGDPSAPKIFNFSLDALLREFEHVCPQNEWGIRMKNSCGMNMYLGILCFADNYWVFATSPVMLQSMLKAWRTISSWEAWLEHPSERAHIPHNC